MGTRARKGKNTFFSFLDDSLSRRLFPHPLSETTLNTKPSRFLSVTTTGGDGSGLSVNGGLGLIPTRPRQEIQHLLFSASLLHWEKKRFFCFCLFLFFFRFSLFLRKTERVFFFLYFCFLKEKKNSFPPPTHPTPPHKYTPSDPLPSNMTKGGGGREATTTMKTTARTSKRRKPIVFSLRSIIRGREARDFFLFVAVRSLALSSSSSSSFGKKGAE